MSAGVCAEGAGADERAKERRGPSRWGVATDVAARKNGVDGRSPPAPAAPRRRWWRGRTIPPPRGLNAAEERALAVVAARLMLKVVLAVPLPSVVKGQIAGGGGSAGRQSKCAGSFTLERTRRLRAPARAVCVCVCVKL